MLACLMTTWAGWKFVENLHKSKTPAASCKFGHCATCLIVSWWRRAEQIVGREWPFSLGPYLWDRIRIGDERNLPVYIAVGMFGRFGMSVNANKQYCLLIERYQVYWDKKKRQSLFNAMSGIP
jgi:hypothetical protein